MPGVTPRHDKIDVELTSYTIEDVSDIFGRLTVDLSATESADNEENVVRTVERMVRDLFRRMRAKGVA